MRNNSFTASTIIGFGFLSVIAGVTALPSPARQQDGAVSPSPSPSVSPEPRVASPTRAKLSEIFRLQKAGKDKEAAALLKTLDPKTLDPQEAARRHQYALTAALRLGDRPWLDELNNDPERAKLAVDLLLLTAMRFLKSSDYDECRALLERVQDPQGLEEVPRRRYLELYARLEQLTGHPERERVYVSKIVDFASRWESPVCQGCHGDYKKLGTAITTIDIKNRWFGERFATLLQGSGESDKVLEAAKGRLDKNPNDTAARLRVVYLLQARGETDAADKALSGFAWAEMPGRPKRVPLQLAVFP